jgi:ketosteroid isomerase-like protein
VEGVRDLFADDYKWHQRREWPGRAVYRRDELPELWAELDETYSQFELKPLEFAAVGDCVLVKVRTSARMRATADRIEAVIWHVWRFANGLVTETRVFSDYDEALDNARG